MTGHLGQSVSRPCGFKHGDPLPDEDYGNAVVVTVTFRGAERLKKAEKLEQAAKRIGHNGIYTEQVEVD